MKRVLLLSLLSTTVLGQSDPSDASPAPSCQGTSTFTGYVPFQTVTVTVDGNYTYIPSGNASTPTAAIFYTPPPPCASVVVPASSTSSGNSLLSALGITDNFSAAAPTPAVLNMTTMTYTSVITWSEQTTVSTCNINFAAASSTTAGGPPYANTSTSTGADTQTSCGPFMRWGTLVTTQTFISAAPIPQSSAGGGGHPHPQNPGQQTDSPPQVVSTGAPPGQSLTATVTITKKTPVQGRATTSAEQIVFPPPSDGSGSPASVPARTTSKQTVGAGTPNNGGSNSPSGGNTNAQDKPATNGNKPTGNAQNPSVGNNSPSNSPPNSQNNQQGPGSNGSPASTPSQGSGIGSIINSAINSPFTTVGLVTSYGAASATVNLVNGVPVQVESSSVYIGGSYVAIPTGSSTALVTVNQQTFTVVSDAVIGGSSTLEIHRSEQISSLAIQAATLQASTVTQNGVVVTIEPTAAIVNGKTYSIGLNAGETSITVNGQAITLNSNGVAFASTTYAPAMITGAAYVVTTIGDLVFSIDSSQAIISGTTYRIGAGALQSLVTTEIDGTTITFGPSGIILPSTTIAPTAVTLTASGMGSAETSGSATARVISQATSQPTLSSNSAATAIRAPAFLSNSLYVISIILALSTLSLGILL